MPLVVVVVFGIVKKLPARDTQQVYENKPFALLRKNLSEVDEGLSNLLKGRETNIHHLEAVSKGGNTRKASCFRISGFGTKILRVHKFTMITYANTENPSI